MQTSIRSTRFRSPATNSHLPTSRFGFTLVELLVSVLIFLVISGFLLANFRSGRQGDRVRAVATAFAADVQRLQAAALAGGMVGDPASAYGVHVDSAQPLRYVLFGDRAADTEPANRRYGAGEELVSGVVTIPGDVLISSVQPTNVVDILFTLPRGAVVTTPDAAEVRVTFRHRDGGGKQSVTVNRISGLVSIE